MLAWATIFLVVTVAATLVDKVGRRDAYATYRSSLHALATKLYDPAQPDVTAQARDVFCQLFDRVYGTTMWSRQRLLGSAISTLLGLFVALLAIGPSETVFGVLFRLSIEESSSGKWASAGLILTATMILTVVLNFVPDFFSLAETRLILDAANKRGVTGLIVLTVLDLCLTTIIFVAMPAVVAYALSVNWQGFIDLALSPGGGLPFLLTTFFTSLSWILFMGAVLAIRVLSLHPATRELVEELLGNSARPTVAFSALANVVVAVLWWPTVTSVGLFMGPELPSYVTGAAVPTVEVGRVYRGSFLATAEYRVNFKADEGSTYVIEATPTLGGDTVLELRVADTEERLQQNDDGGRGLGSRIEFVSESDDLYTVAIVNFSEDMEPASDFVFVIRENARPLDRVGRNGGRDERADSAQVAGRGVAADSEAWSPRYRAETPSARSNTIVARLDESGE